MKKIYGLIAVLAVVAMALPASAFENKFGGFFRTRAYTFDNFDPAPGAAANQMSKVDTRTRLYYTAVFNENLKFVNKFEMDAIWGDTAGSYGDIGADGVCVEVKNTYLDMNLGNVNVKVGTQGGTVARGFLFDDDFSGLNVSFKAGDVTVPVMWIKNTEGGNNNGFDENDRDYYVVAPVVTLNNNLTVNPYILYDRSDDAGRNLFYLGVDADMTLDAAGVWFTGIFETGDVTDDVDASAYLVALGGNVNAGAADIHGQVFYASGDDGDDDTDDNFASDLDGRSYYWAEIMGYGTFDFYASNGTCADAISNITAANIGVSLKPMDKLKVTADIWYAMLNEVPSNADDELGTEIDLVADYALMDNVNLKVVAAYLVAGDATNSEDDPYEVGTQLSLAF